uniref:Short-chain dehydrogenase/reductase family 16C member 6 n=1 Tax=Rhabditophanes sp. KR3021 TaxID=114890 RepID=A0AC35TWB2_9BILA
MDSLVDKVVATFVVLIKLILVAIPRDLIRFLGLRCKDVKGQVIVITGGASGIGKKVAEVLSVKKGATVVILDVDEVNGHKTVHEIESLGGVASFYYCDTTDIPSLKLIESDIVSIYSRVDIVVCNAAILYFGLAHQLTDSQLKRAYDVNIHGTLNTIRAFLPRMESINKGQVVSICSITGWAGDSYGLAYCPTKFAVRGIMETIQMELDDRGLDGVNTTTIYPYFVRTPMISNAGIRPTSRWIPFMSTDRCARGVVDALLKEKFHAFIPNYVALVIFINSLLGRYTRKLMRDFLNCKYVPVVTKSTSYILDENCNPVSISELPKMAVKKEKYFFKSPSEFWWILITMSLLVNYLVWTNVTLLPLGYMGPVGTFLGRFEKEWNWIAQLTNYLALIAHVGEALLATYYCSLLNLTMDSTILWFFQTLVLGFPSLSILISKKRNQTKYRKMKQTN